ncbi:MAG: AAA family ATPase [Pirellulales bacterium]
MTWPPLIAGMLDPAVYPHAAGPVEIIETHISWLLLTGPYAYKIKKPVDLGFLDFSTLARREHFCREELRLNRRYAPRLYEAVVPIGGTPDRPRLEQPGQPIEYAVRMVQFPSDCRLDHVLQSGRLTSEHIDGLAAELARQHAVAAVSSADNAFGEPAAVWQVVANNLEQMQRRANDSQDQQRLQQLALWSQREFERRKADFALRKQQGSIRECHGDLHLANMVLLENRVTLFDCLEFNDNLRWIDTQSDLAFAVMDLRRRGRPELAARLLNGYLEVTGDYRGLAVLPFYLVYRALVRATVAAIRACQPDVGESARGEAWSEFRDYLSLAESYANPPPSWLLLTHGPSGSGKTYYTQRLVQALGAIRVRSDVERKRLAGLQASARTPPSDVEQMYGPATNQATYGRLLEAARQIVSAGFPAIIDAACLRQADRAACFALAADLKVPVCILDLRADHDTLRRRLQSRQEAGQDASEATLAVLEAQLANDEPITAAELPRTITLDAANSTDDSAWIGRVRRMCER